MKPEHDNVNQNPKRRPPRYTPKLGDSVVVKPGVKDPDLGADIAGWQGRITEIDRANRTIGIDWDSLTLRQMPDDMIAWCEQEGLAWHQMYLGSNEVEAVPARDTPADVAQVVKQMQARHAWSHLGPEGRLIQTVLAGVDEADEMGAMAAWESQLRRKLAWPFEAEVAEFQESGPLRAGDRVTVRRIVDVDETYGVLVYVEKPRRGELTFPLADLEVVDQTSPNYPLVEAYVAWFANR